MNLPNLDWVLLFANYPKLAIILSIIGVAWALLKWKAPKTKTKKDDEIVEKIKKSWYVKILDFLNPFK